jgi:hypothetical protein
MEHATFVTPARSAQRLMADAGRSADSIPWQGWVAVCSVACLPVGLLWDISWHSTIGRDTFWTPAHIVIQLGGLVPALLFAWLAFQKTFFGGGRADASRLVKIAGVSAPLGAWVTIWGAVAMLTSAPFDDWWHNTYGLDVQIVSPPHSILGAGMFAVTAGVLLFVFSQQNRAFGRQTRSGAILCALAAGVMLTLFSDFLTEFTFPNQQHSPPFYRITAAVYPLVLVMTARASRLRWAATIAAATYMTVLMLMIWILPLFPAEPKLAPIYHPVTHMVPPAFPLLLIVPGLGVDLFMRKFGRRTASGDGAFAFQDETINDSAATRARPATWGFAAGFGAVFLALFVPTQWFFSKFLLSDAAENWFFARSGHFPYFAQPNEWWYRFWERDSHPFGVGDYIAIGAIAVISARIGLWFGDYLRKVRR